MTDEALAETPEFRATELRAKGLRDAKLRVEKAFAARAEAGRPLRLWLRDDDAVRPTPALDRLLQLTGVAQVPMVLAVIPAPFDQPPTGPDLAELLRDRPDVTVAVHGWSHRNHAPLGVKKQELGPHRPVDEMRAELRAGLMRLAALHGTRARPLLVPPWNRIAPELVAVLAEDGFEAISTFGPEVQVPGLTVINSQLDVIDWHGTRGGRDPAELWADLADLAESWREHIGVLTHHLVHDDAVWAFLADLIQLAARSGAVWCPVTDLYTVPAA